MKTVKRILCLFTAILLCLSLSACNALDELRASHAIKQEDGTILWNGYTYRALDCDYGMLNDSGRQIIPVTDPEVPVLFSRLEGHPHYVSANGILLVSANYMEDTVFCREDYYAWVQDGVENGFEVESYGFHTINYDYIDEKPRYLSQEERASIDRMLSETPTHVYSTEEWMFCLFIYGFSRYDILQKYICAVMWTGQEYVLEREDGYGFELYYVPESEWAVLDELCGGRPADYVPKVEEETASTTQSTIAMMVSTTKAARP